MLRTILSTVTVVVLVALVACTTAPPEAPASASAAGAGPGPGWRKGLVVQAGDRDSLGPPLDSDCRTKARTAGEAARGAAAPARYVEVQYFVGRHAHLRIVPIDDALEVAAGDTVWFRSFGCGSARKAAPASS